MGGGGQKNERKEENLTLSGIYLIVDLKKPLVLSNRNLSRKKVVNGVYLYMVLFF